MSISTKIPHSLLFHRSSNQFLKPIKFLSLPSSPTNFFFSSKSITFQRIFTIESKFSASSSSSPSVSVQPIEELPSKASRYHQIVPGSSSTKGQGLSGQPVEEILRVSPDFVVLIWLQQSLTPSRNNGFLNMLKLMQKKALQLYMESEKGGNSSTVVAERNPAENSDLGLKNDGGNGKSNVKESPSALESGVGNGSVLGNRGTRIKERLEKELRPIELEVEDISHQHAGHAGVKGREGETHFNVKVVSEGFEGKSLVKRHRLIYSLLQDELQNGLHALSIVAKTPSEVDPQ
ncbi:sufE-like protein 1 [Forsythia ovata]|uniref:SufE-like protein 1 n=1 Tax=Forsythia ovata TaxID=205694 RepID=A0ABD1S5H0_9LAMI